MFENQIKKLAELASRLPLAVKDVPWIESLSLVRKVIENKISKLERTEERSACSQWIVSSCIRPVYAAEWWRCGVVVGKPDRIQHI